MAVPGNITSLTSTGTNNLIKTGAILVTEAKDVLFALGLNVSRVAQTELLGSNEAEVAILPLLKYGISDASILLTESNLTAADFNQTLTMLEISGKIRPLGSNHWSTL